MYGFKKIILSRKGFDSSAGGDYSPFDPSTGKYIVLPIPERKKDWKISNPLKFQDVKIRRYHLSEIDVSNLKELITVLGLRCEIRGRDPLTRRTTAEKSEYCHFDPWLGPCPWLETESDHKVGVLGQQGIAEKHLRSEHVGIGSLFLFFNRFVPIRGRENVMGFAIDTKKGAYFIYGWLVVGRKVETYSDISNPEIERRHPHATKDYFEMQPDNALYIAADTLSLNGFTYLGCGYFPRLSKKLLLTSEKDCQTPTKWELPAFFYERELRPTYMMKDWRWKKEEGWSTCFVKIPFRGQEFVFKPSNDCYIWLGQLFAELRTSLKHFGS
jgi:hypothetical protein